MNEITAIKEGIEPAFVKVYEDFHVKAFRFFFKSTRDHETSRELTQQTFIKLWRSRHTLSEAFSLDTQLYTIAGTILIDHIRKESARKKLFAVLRKEASPEKNHSAAFPAASFEKSDYLSTVVERLPPVRKKVIILKTQRGFSNEEIARELSISVKTVEIHVTKAIRQIRSFGTLILILLAFFRGH